MSCDTPSLEEFLQAHINDIQQLLLRATGSVRSASKKVLKISTACCYGDMYI